MKETSDNKSEENRPHLKSNFKWGLFSSFFCQVLPKAFSAIAADFMFSANIYILQFNDFLSNILNLSLIDMKSSAIAENT